MREIKFRVWNEGLKRMFYTDKYTTVWCGGKEASVNTSDGQIPGTFIPMQLTGLKDKNGKDGYHKDMIVNSSRNGGNPHVLEWSDKLGTWVGKYGKLEYVLATELHECEFVGNIYEDKNT